MKLTLLKPIIAVFAFLLLFFPSLANASANSIDFFWANGCPHCAHEKEFLDQLQAKYPQLEINSYDVTANQENVKLFQQKGKELSADISGVPFTVIGSKYVIGFGTAQTTGKEIESLILQELKLTPKQLETPQTASPAAATNQNPDAKASPPQQEDKTIQSELGSIHIPLIGELDVKQVSLPVLTFLIALIDGFNPCAMWTLLFLISLLLGMKDRKRMWILGTAFIVSSAFVYFLFLSAWLNLFLFLGLVVWVRVVIALVALTAGTLYLKEYIENKTGCKVMGNTKRQKVFEKLRTITSKRNFLVALGGIILLAFAVNLVELICSAGLPAIYTKVLSMYQLPAWQYYLYLIFYIIVFMLDDLFIFITAMITLQAVGIQSKYSRASHLVGGILMLLIGLLLLFRPDILMFG